MSCYYVFTRASDGKQIAEKLLNNMQTGYLRTRMTVAELDDIGVRLDAAPDTQVRIRKA